MLHETAAMEKAGQDYMQYLDGTLKEVANREKAAEQLRTDAMTRAAQITSSLEKGDDPDAKDLNDEMEAIAPKEKDSDGKGETGQANWEN